MKKFQNLISNYKRSYKLPYRFTRIHDYPNFFTRPQILAFSTATAMEK